MKECTEHPLDVPVEEEPLTGNFRAFDLLRVLSAAFSLLACLLTLIQIYNHSTHYTAPKSQRQIIRILFMAPVYCIFCALSIQFYRYHVYLAAVYEFYESLVVAAFFLLLCQFIREDMTDLRRVFNMLTPMDWIGPIKLFRAPFRCGKKRKLDGLRWLNMVWLAVHQFCLIKLLGAIAKCISEVADVYCAESNSKSHTNLWIGIVEMVSLTIAMLFLLQFYKQTHEALKEHEPLFKFLAVKAVIFLFLVQTFIFSRLTVGNGPLQPTSQISFPSLAVGIPNTLLCFEMMLVSILNFWAYPAKPYYPNARSWSKPATKPRPLIEDEESDVAMAYSSHPPAYPMMPPEQGHIRGYGPVGSYPAAEHRQSFQSDREQLMGETQVLPTYGGTLGWRAVLDAIKITDIFRNAGIGLHWLFVARRRDDSKRFDADLRQRSGGGSQGMRTKSLSEAMARA